MRSHPGTWDGSSAPDQDRWGESWGIGAIPTIGYRKDKVGFDLAFLKESGLLFLAGYSFD